VVLPDDGPRAGLHHHRLDRRGAHIQTDHILEIERPAAVASLMLDLIEDAGLRLDATVAQQVIDGYVYQHFAVAVGPATCHEDLLLRIAEIARNRRNRAESEDRAYSRFMDL